MKHLKIIIPLVLKNNMKCLLWLLFFSGVASHCTSEELDKVGEEVATCVIREQELVREIKKMPVGKIYKEVIIQTIGHLYSPVYRRQCVQSWTR